LVTLTQQNCHNINLLLKMNQSRTMRADLHPNRPRTPIIRT
jgi:hypothetical protein